MQQELDAWMIQQGDQGMDTEAIAKSRQGSGPQEAEDAASQKKKGRKKAKKT